MSAAVRALEPEFGFGVPLTAGPWQHQCIVCGAKSARAFEHVGCGARSVSVASLERFRNERAAVSL